MKSHVIAIVGALALFATIPVFAKKWVDYTPQKGYWEIRYVKVDPNKIDEYLTTAKTSWAPSEGVLKEEGLIYGYRVMVSITPANGKANVIFMVHYVSFANLEPSKARDQEIDMKMNALLPQAKSDAMATDFNKYRTFVGDQIYVPVRFTR